MSKAIEIQPPNHLRLLPDHINVFLGGSIEMGLAEEWQKSFMSALKDKPYTFFNPRRSDWNSDWVQEIGNNNFKEQVTWELNSLEIADVIVMYFDPNTKSPISLLELGLHAKERKLIVICPDGFWRKGNVDIVCEMYDIKQISSFNELIEIFINANTKEDILKK